MRPLTVRVKLALCAADSLQAISISKWLQFALSTASAIWEKKRGGIVKEDSENIGEHLAAVVTIRSQIDAMQQLAANQLETISSLRAQAETAIKAIEEDTRKANSESGFAFNAKVNAEDHAKAIAQIRGTVEATFAGLTSTKQTTEELVKAISVFRTGAEADAKSAADAKATVVRDAAVVTAAAERIAAVMPSIDKGSKDANAISAAKGSAEATVVALTALQTQMNEAIAKATTEGASIAKAEAKAKELTDAMTAAAATAQAADARVAQYELEIAKLKSTFEATHEKLESLLPHATSAGLASAFHNQKARFSKPQPYWLGLFVAAIAFLLIAACFGLPSASDTWDSILRHFVNRLPLVGPLIWLAIYAGHHYNMALKMEEDYAFKEAVSTAFEGYKREMQGIPVREGSTENPLVTLCENVLRALAERPGRIYEGKTDVVTPLTPATTALKETIAEMLKTRSTTPPP